MANYTLSADGGTVVRLVPQSTIAASSLTSASLGFGYTATAGSDGSLTVTNGTYYPGFFGGSGGATIQALYTDPTLPVGESLEWVQVITTNDPASGRTSPYLDNGSQPQNSNAPLYPFYALTAANRLSPLAPTALNFFDFSRRPPADLSKTSATHAANTPITWNAKLYPVLVKGTQLTVENGIGWGWTMNNAMVGTDTGFFVNPSPGAVAAGVGTSNFSWGIPSPDAGGSLIRRTADSSSLSFTGGSFHTQPNTMFKLGTITYHNGTTNGGEASSVELDMPTSFTNVPEMNLTLKTTFNITTTPNTSDPVASADYVTIGNYGFTFDVEEGQTASADIYATLYTGLQVTQTSASSDAALASSFSLDPSAGYTLNIVGVTNSTGGGFVRAAFSVDDRTTNLQTVSGGTPYSGPVVGLQYEYINITPDNLNIAAGLPNTFIHSGSGFDALDVSAVGGTNVLDGGTNSNFLVGGTGAGSSDTFFVDDRSPASDIWSTVANFHVGDAATIFGITQTNFDTTWVDGQGATGFTGLTLHVTAPGVPTASLTLSRFSSADLTNGRLSTSFGTETDGTPYLYVHANT